MSGLSARCGGWIAFDMNEGEVFIPLSDWKRTFAADGSKHLSDDKEKTA
jgi:hypothetical protein